MFLKETRILIFFFVCIGSQHKWGSERRSKRRWMETWLRILAELWHVPWPHQDKKVKMHQNAAYVYIQKIRIKRSLVRVLVYFLPAG